jgi:hypothetical protein
MASSTPLSMTEMELLQKRIEELKGKTKQTEH